MADGKGDLEAAAKYLDNAISTIKNADKFQLLKILVLRTDIATRLDDFTLAKELLKKAKTVATGLDKKLIKEELRLIREIQDR